MNSCVQTKNQSVLVHGHSVSLYYKDLINHIKFKSLPKFNWKIPEILYDNNLLDLLLPSNIMQEYHVYHDCGKPFCVEVDKNGNSHFPSHAKKSKEIWQFIKGNKQVGKLIEMDMDIHLLKNEGVEEFSKRKEAVSLIFTGLAEVHSNAEMFGGIDSKSFKIKFKQIDRRAKAIVKLIKKRGVINEK